MVVFQNGFFKSVFSFSDQLRSFIAQNWLVLLFLKIMNSKYYCAYALKLGGVVVPKQAWSSKENSIIVHNCFRCYIKCSYYNALINNVFWHVIVYNIIKLTLCYYYKRIFFSWGGGECSGFNMGEVQPFPIHVKCLPWKRWGHYLDKQTKISAHVLYSMFTCQVDETISMLCDNACVCFKLIVWVKTRKYSSW